MRFKIRCSFYRWLISRALDDGAPGDEKLPGVAKRHVEKCSSCSAFARLSRSLPERLSRDAEEIKDAYTAPGAQNRAAAFTGRILSVLEAESFPRPVPAKPMRRRLPVLVPALGVLIVVFAAGLISILIPGSGPDIYSGPSNRPEFKLPFLSKITEKPILANLINRAESPLKSELEVLESKVSSAAEFVFSCLDPGLGKNRPGQAVQNEPNYL